MSDQQVKELFATVLEGGPADRLDLDRAVAAGRRRRRIRTATTLASAAAVLVVVGALVVSVLPDDGRADLGGATLSPTPSATASEAPAIIAGSADDWARALEPYLPAGTETPAEYVSDGAWQSYPSHSNARAAFRLVRDDRATALVVTAYADVPELRGSSEVVAARLAELEQSCDGTTVTCDARVESSSGPVIVRRWADGSHIAASSVRENGVVVTVDSWNGDTTQDRILEGSGKPGLADDIDALVTLAASVPLPAVVMTTPTPVPTTDATTAEPQPSGSSSGPEPIPTGTAPTPEPTPTPTPKAAGLVGTTASSPCPASITFEYRPQVPIMADVLQYVLCPLPDLPHGVGDQVFVTPDDGAFAQLDAALRLGDTQPYPKACPLSLPLLRLIFVQTEEGWFKVQPPYDGCQPKPELLDAMSAVVDAG